MCKIWTAIMAEIFHSGLPKLNMRLEDCRENEGGRSRVRMRASEKDR